MKDSLTDITFLLDRTGSMQSKHSDVVGGYNAFVQRQKEAVGDALFTFVQFDSTEPYEVIHNAKPIKEIPEMKMSDFVPRDMTPLYDTLGTTIVKTGERLAAMPEADRPGQVVFVVLTDGLENDSREYSKQRVRGMIHAQQTIYKWAFVFMGVDIDAMGLGADIGIRPATTVKCAEEKTGAAIMMASDKVATYRGTQQLSDLEYSQADRNYLE